jgi:Flp pilus assembly protein TadG
LQHHDGQTKASRRKRRAWSVSCAPATVRRRSDRHLSVPYFIIVFAIFETFAAYTAEQLVTNAVNTMARELRTGNITYNLGRSTDMTETQFRAAFCEEVAIMIACSASEPDTPEKLYLDVETLPTFKAIADKASIPRTGGAYSDLDTSAFHFTPGGPDTINLLRAYYRWNVTFDLIRAITHPAGQRHQHSSSSRRPRSGARLP